MSDAIVVTAFVSYSWDDEDHKKWVRELAARLRGDGITVALDQWELVPGDQLPAFMERSIRNSSYVLVVCTPGYKKRSDERKGGVGYEGDIITGELLTQQNHRKFIPILRAGEWEQAAPSWLKGKYHIDLRGEPYSEAHYQDLLTTLLGTRPQAPPVATRTANSMVPKGYESPKPRVTATEPIRITGLIADKVTMPKLDGTQGSALYQVPFRLSRRPDSEWIPFFIEAWNHPPSFTTMHRPGTAEVEGDIVWLRRTTMDEVERYHRDTLKLAVNQANAQYLQLTQERARREEQRAEQERAHRAAVQDAAHRIKFD
jgi:hypothetical protein